MGRARVSGAIAATAGAVLVIIGSAMPWLRSGGRRRSSFELFAVVDRLGVAPGGVQGWGVRLWPVVPLLAVACAVLAWSVPKWSQRNWPLLAAAAITVLYAGGAAWVMDRVDENQFIGIELGPAVTLFGATLLFAGAAVATFPTHANSDSRRSTRRAHRRREPVRDP